MHGHNYEMEVAIEGKVAENGFIIDFWDLDAIVQPIVNMIDHRTLNDIEGLENPTAELIACWFLEKVAKEFDQHSASLAVAYVKIFETKDCWAMAQG
jgi:6-pyruvoyltetrahydropterin/6-carboxytetrahydropterin synthase